MFTSFNLSTFSFKFLFANRFTHYTHTHTVTHSIQMLQPLREPTTKNYQQNKICINSVVFGTLARRPRTHANFRNALFVWIYFICSRNELSRARADRAAVSVRCALCVCVRFLFYRNLVGQRRLRVITNKWIDVGDSLSSLLFSVWHLLISHVCNAKCVLHSDGDCRL